MDLVCSFRLALLLAAVALFTVACGNSTPPISVKLSPSSAQAIDASQSVSITAKLTNDASGKGVSWTLSGPGSISSTGLIATYNAPAQNVTTAQAATITATSLADRSKQASLQITVNPYPYVAFQQLASGSVGTPYSQVIAVTGGTPPFQWSIYNGPIITGNYVGGSVPDGLTLNVNSGTISGTPTGGGTWYFETIATDATGAFGFNALSIQIDSNAPPGNPVPFVNQPLSPTAVAPGSSGFTLKVSGTGFTPGTTVDFNSVPLTTAFLDSGHLSAIVPAAAVANVGTASVTVVNPAPGGGRSNSVYFQAGAPTAQGTFPNLPSSTLAASSAAGLVVGDFNQDGKADLAVTGISRIYVFLGNGDGTFSPAGNSPVPLPSPPYDDFGTPYSGPIVTGDFNNSGHLGLAVGELQNEAAVILLGRGDGTFAPSSAAFIEVPAIPISGLAAADFNADGNLDLASVSQLYGMLPTALGYGKGAFISVGQNSIGLADQGVVVGDFNVDGKLDVVHLGGGLTGTGTSLGSGVGVTLGNGDGTFTPASGSPMIYGQSLSAGVAADFNGDGKLDVAVCDSTANLVTIFLGDGSGTLSAANVLGTGTQPDAIVAGDFNNDGKLDLAVANFADGTVTLLLGNGDGTFTSASGQPFTVGRGPYAIAAADFNGDGKLDLAVANLTDGTVSILLQQ